MTGQNPLLSRVLPGSVLFGVRTFLSPAEQSRDRPASLRQDYNNPICDACQLPYVALRKRASTHNGKGGHGKWV
jgi:hypothetical protein